MVISPSYLDNNNDKNKSVMFFLTEIVQPLKCECCSPNLHYYFSVIFGDKAFKEVIKVK